MDPWLAKIVQRLKQAQSRAEIQSVIDDLDDRYDAFAGPGQEWIEQLLSEARNRLSQLTPPR